jgi:hypothetical protein
MARNSKLTPELQEELLKLIGAGAYIRQACEFVGISEASVYLWISRGSKEILRMETDAKAKPSAKEKAYVEFYYAFKKAENASEMRAIAIWQQTMSDDWRAAKEFLARRFPDRWSPRLEVTGADGQPVAMNLNVDVVTLEQKVQAVLEARNGRAISGSDTVIESD